MSSFDETVSICLENLTQFADSIREVHDISKCNLDKYDIREFSNELYSYVHFRKRRCLRLEKKIFLNLCKKFAQVFKNCFIASQNKKIMICFLRKSKNERRRNSGDNRKGN